MQFADSEICQITQTIWSSVLGLEAERNTWKVVPEGKERYLTGCVSISGAWEGALTVDCSANLARQAAAIMLQVEPEKTSPDDIQDALGELTNMLGGNIKRLLPGPSRLSLPAVAEGIDYKLKVAGSQVLSEIAFDCDGEMIRVRLLERDEEQTKSFAGKRSAAVVN